MVVALLVAVVVLGVIFVWNLGSVLIAPANHPLGRPPANLPVQAVEFPSASGATVHGWLVPGQPGKGAVVLLHGNRASRLVMLSRAEFLSRAGYAVLLIDFQAHGESLGKNLTFGFLESRDVTAAVQFVRERCPGESIGVLGISLGAAAALLAEPPLPVQALVLESCYPTIYQATEDRLVMRFGWPGRLATPLLTCQLPFRLGVVPADLQPIRHVGNIRVPKLFIAGTEDRDTTLPESRALFAAAAGPKQFWPVTGAAHVDMHAFNKAGYETRVLDFLAANLPPPRPLEPKP